MHELQKSKKLPADRFILRGYADTRPRVPNNSAANRSKNRRVEIMIDQRESSQQPGANGQKQDGETKPEKEPIIINADTMEQFENETIHKLLDEK